MFANKVVLITGSSTGIGAATAQSFAKEEACLAIVARNEDKLKEVAKVCEELGAKAVLTIKADVSKEEEAKTIVKRTVDKFGKIDVLVNNAGITRVGNIEDNNVLEIYDEIMKTNVRAVIHITHLAAPHLKATKGNIVNVSSVASTKAPYPGTSAYHMSKAALDHFTKGAAVEFAPSGVRVNSINPGPVITDILKNSNFPKEMIGKFDLKGITVLERVSQPEEMADLILYMASDKAKSITGSCYIIDNGMAIK